MWDGWVDIEKEHTYIIGHWNYSPDVAKPVYVVSTGDRVELFVNGKSKGFGKQDCRFLFTFEKVQWEKGTIEAVSYNEFGKELSRYSIETVGEPEKLKLTLMHSPEGLFADGADLAMIQVEVVDSNGNRCPLANNMVRFNLQGPAEWRGGIAQAADNYVLAKALPVECGITRVLVRSTDKAGKITIKAEASGLVSDEVSLTSIPVKVENGLSKFFPSEKLASRFDRGETPLTPSYKNSKVDVRVKSAVAGVNSEEAINSFDSNELSEWKNDGRLSTAWITYQLERKAEIDDICIKLTGWRKRSYPLEIFADDELIWSGNTEQSLGYIHLAVKPVRSDKITIRLKGAAKEADAFKQIVEVVEPSAGDLDLLRAKNGEKTNNELRIVEVEFLETINR